MSVGRSKILTIGGTPAVISIQKIISEFPAESIGAIGLTGQMHGSGFA
jgi:sugar (pentulose or hexulose) kinase